MPSKKTYYDPKKEAQSNEHWIPWLQRQLNLHDILTQTPEWPRPYEPNYRDWLEVFEQFLVDKDTTLIGHSCGGGFLVRWLSENEVNVGKVILVAPWLDPEGELSENDFFKFKIDPNIAKKTKGIVIFGSNDDEKCIQESIKTLIYKIDNVNYKEFNGYGHFVFSDMKTREFPKLLESAMQN